jgi:hypothetical protein
MEEGALVPEHAPAVRREIFANLRVALAALAVLAREAVAGGDGVELVALTGKLAVAVLIELAIKVFHGRNIFLGSFESLFPHNT